MKVTGTRSQVWFDLENGYIAKASGELLVGGVFVVETSTMKFWEPPHEREAITPSQIEMIVNNVNQLMNKNTAQIIFE